MQLILGFALFVGITSFSYSPSDMPEGEGRYARIMARSKFHCAAKEASALKSLHPFYMSSTKIALNPNSHRLEISLKFFADNLETSLQAFNGKKFFLQKDGQHKEQQDLIFKYVQTHFKLSSNNQPLVLEWLGGEGEEDVFWIYLESGFPKDATSLSVSHTALIKEFPEQENIVRIALFGKEESNKLNASSTSWVFSK